MSKKSSQQTQRKDEVNRQMKVLPSLQTKCFVCDEHIQGQSVNLVVGRTQFSNGSYPSKIGELVGDDFMVVVCMEDALCAKCVNLLNQLDKLEIDLKMVRRTLTGYLASKYNISHRDLFAKFETGGICEKKNAAKLTEAVKTTPKIYRCELCRFSTTDRAEVAIHIEECLELPHACSVCPKRFASIKDHAQHAVLVHKLTSSCPICSSLFVSEKEVAEHIKSHPHCTVCNIAFLDQIHVEDHTKKEHQAETPVIENKNVIEACFEELIRDDAKPNVVCEDATEIEFHTCNICALTFLKASLFNEHLKMHKKVGQDSQAAESLTTNLATNDACRIEDDLDDLFEKLHAETGDSAKSQKSLTNGITDSPTSKTDPPVFVGNVTQAESSTKDVEQTPLETSKSNGENLKASSSLNQPPEIVAEKQCCVCLKLFLSKYKLRLHFDTHRSGNPKCSLCGELVSAQTFLEHCRKHSPSTFSRRAKCRFCSLTFTTKSSCESHEETHSNVSAFVCAKCNKRFSTQEKLSAHEDRLHRTDPQCRHCGKKMDNLKALRNHEKRHTKPTDNLECKVCLRAFKSKSSLFHHAAVHTGEFAYHCEFCGKGFISRLMWEEHRGKHTKEARFVCDICGRKFSFKSSYWIHRKWHENPNPYKCNICGRLFKHTSLLAVHKRKHTGERPYKCPHCPLTFAVGTSFKRHVILHTGAFPYKCQDCKKGFTTRDKYSLHRAKVHEDYELINNRSLPKDFKMAVRETVESEAQVEDSLQLRAGGTLEQVVCKSAESETQHFNSSVVDGATFALSGQGLSSGNRVVEIVMDDSYQAIATVTVAGVTDSERGSEAWYS